MILDMICIFPLSRFQDVYKRQGQECNMSYAEFKNLTDVDLATRTFCAKFERPVFAYADIEYRIQMAYQVYESFAG